MICGRRTKGIDVSGDLLQRNIRAASVNAEHLTSVGVDDNVGIDILIIRRAVFNVLSVLHGTVFRRYRRLIGNVIVSRKLSLARTVHRLGVASRRGMSQGRVDCLAYLLTGYCFGRPLRLVLGLYGALFYVDKDTVPNAAGRHGDGNVALRNGGDVACLIDGDVISVGRPDQGIGYKGGFAYSEPYAVSFI